MTEEAVVRDSVHTIIYKEDKEIEEKTELEVHDMDKVKVPLTRAQFISVFLCFACAVFLVAIDTTIISTAIPAIATEFQALDQISWVGSGFFLTSTAFSPVYGELTNIFGRKPTFLVAVFLFELGSLMCGVAPSMLFLILGRVVAGIGGGGIFSCVLIMLSDVTSLRDSGKYQGVIGAVFGLSSVIGPLIGGVFTDRLTWRWCFYINLPIGVIAAAVIFYMLKFPSPEGDMMEKLKKVDYLGTAVIVAATTVLLVPLQFGGSVWQWTEPRTISMLVLGILLLVFFAYVETKASHPIIPPRLFANKTVAAGLLSALFLGCIFISLFYYVPTYFQLVNNESATNSGLESIPMIFGLVTFSIVSGVLISKTGKYRYWFFLGSVVSVVGLALVSTFSPSTSRGLQILYLLILGCGIGMVIQVRMYAVQMSVDREDIAAVTSTSNFMMNMGGTIGLAVSGSVFINGLQTELGPTLTLLATTDPIGVRNNANATLIINAISSSLGKSYYFGIAMGVLIFICGFFIIEKVPPPPKAEIIAIDEKPELIV